MRSRADIDRLRAEIPALAGLSDYDLVLEPEIVHVEVEAEVPKGKRGKATTAPEDTPDTPDAESE